MEFSILRASQTQLYKRMKLSDFWKKKALTVVEKTILDSNNVKVAAKA